MTSIALSATSSTPQLPLSLIIGAVRPGSTSPTTESTSRWNAMNSPLLMSARFGVGSASTSFPSARSVFMTLASMPMGSIFSMSVNAM